MAFVERTDWVDTPSAPPPPGSTPVRAEGDIKRWERGIAEAHEQLDGRLSEEGLNSTYAPVSVADEVADTAALVEDILANQRLATAAQMHRYQSAASETARLDNQTSVTELDWSGASGWEGWNAAAFSVADGILLSEWDSGETTFSLSKPFAIGAGKTGQVSAVFTVPETAPGSNQALYAMVAVRVAATHPGGYGDLIGVGVNERHQAVAFPVTGTSSADAVLSPTALAAGKYTATIDFGADWISFTVAPVAAGTGPMLQTRAARSTFATVGRAVVINRDSRKPSGVGISELVAVSERSSVVSAIPRPAPLHIWTHTSAASTTENVRIITPPDYDSATPTPLVIFCHGSGRDAATLGNDNTAALVRAVSQAGYLVAAGDFGGNAWGNQTAIDTVVDLYDFARANFAIGPVLLLAASMGGLTSLNTLARREVPGIAGWYGMYPVTNLGYQYANNPTHKTAIDAAYGSTDFATVTAGHDPMLRQAWEFRGVPMRMAASDGDTSVSKANNADLFAAKMSDVAPEASVLAGTGEHGSVSTTVASDVLDFFFRCLAAA